MKLSNIYTILESVEIMPFDVENDIDGIDPYVALDEADGVAASSGIRILSNKDLRFIATYNHKVIGGIWASMENGENGQYIYDFDVAVSPEYRGSERIGLKLIEAAINDYKSLDIEEKMIRVGVINPQLVRILEIKYGFKIESKSRDGSTNMVYY